MKTWNKTEKQTSLSSRHGLIYNRILVVLLAIALVGGSFGGVAAAADEVVTNVYINATSGNHDSGTVFVDDDPLILTAYATISGAPEKNVTTDGTWSSTSTSVKVSNGQVTATAPVAKATITVRYKDKTDSFEVTAEYKYDELKLKLDSADVPEKKTVDLGKDLNLTAWGIKNGASTDETKNAAWTSSNSSVATVDKGVVKLLTEGEVTITAKYKGKTKAVELKVESPYEEIHVKKADGSEIKAPIELSLGVDEWLQLKATAELKSGATPDPDITQDTVWTTSNASVIRLDDKVKGKFIPVGKGTAVITAKRFGLSDAVTVIVKTEYEALKVTPDKSIYLTQYGAPVELTATAASGSKGTESVTAKAEWSISDEGQAVAVVTKETSDKVFVTPKGAGSTQVTVKYLGMTKSISVNVSPTIESISVVKDELDVFVEETGALPVINGTLLTGESRDVTNYVEWTTDAQGENAVLVIEDGKWKAKKQGTAKLIAKVPGVQGKILAKEVTVKVHNKILALIPSQDTISVVIGKEVDLPKVQLIYEDGEEEPISEKITWKSSTPNLLVKSTSMKGLLAANATLTGTYLNKTVKIKVTVEEEFTSFAITPAKISLTLNRSQSIKVVGTTKSGKKVSLGSRIDWTASTEDHFAIKGASAKALVEGSGKLTATVQGKTLEIPYIITAKLTKLTASTTSVSGAIGSTTNVEVTAIYENGKTASVASLATWTTSKSAVATVSPTGQITIKGKGSASIKGTFAGKTVTIRVAVK